MRFPIEEQASSETSEAAFPDEDLKPINKPLDVGSFREAKRKVALAKENSPERPTFTGQEDRKPL